MTQHHSRIVTDTATDFILYPMSDELRQSPDDPLVLAKARRAVTLYSNLLQAILAKHSHEIDLDSIEHDPGNRLAHPLSRPRSGDDRDAARHRGRRPRPERSGSTQLSHLQDFRRGIAWRVELASHTTCAILTNIRLSDLRIVLSYRNDYPCRHLCSVVARLSALQ